MKNYQKSIFILTLFTLCMCGREVGVGKEDPISNGKNDNDNKVTVSPPPENKNPLGNDNVNPKQDVPQNLKADAGNKPIDIPADDNNFKIDTPKKDATVKVDNGGSKTENPKATVQNPPAPPLPKTPDVIFVAALIPKGDLEIELNKLKDANSIFYEDKLNCFYIFNENSIDYLRYYRGACPDTNNSSQVANYQYKFEIRDNNYIARNGIKIGEFQKTTTSTYLFYKLCTDEYKNACKLSVSDGQLIIH